MQAQGVLRHGGIQKRRDKSELDSASPSLLLDQGKELKVSEAREKGTGYREKSAGRGDSFDAGCSCSGRWFSAGLVRYKPKCSSHWAFLHEVNRS